MGKETAVLEINVPILKIENHTYPSRTKIEVDLSKGWGWFVNDLVETACAVSGQPEAARTIKDILMAKEPSYIITERKRNG